MATNGDSPETSAADTSRDPSGFLSEIIGAPVTVKLNSGIVYKGDLQSVDGYMNIALERCKEWSDGKLVRSWGDAFVRGNNGEMMSESVCIFLLTRTTVTYISADNA
ncbi:U4/U6-U5 snRNP complex subunit lsm6 [Paraconiothyrium brasiliense]|uniref:U6 snRNA-associated Sm-like protein LSm6 n=1 Tax=Paraconiothyrium brasiliense TaxID=300254 RepID=A0ABR3QUA6_9PLEO